MSFSEKLKYLRDSEKMSQQQLADKIGVTKGAIWKYENNHASPTAEIIKSVALTFNVTTDYLLFDESEKDAIQKIPNKILIEQFDKISRLNDADKEYTIKTINLILERNENKQ